MMWTDLVSALCLAMVLEGIFPFLNPRSARQVFATMASLDDRTVRILGFVSMMLGSIVLYLAR